MLRFLTKYYTPLAAPLAIGFIQVVGVQVRSQVFEAIPKSTYLVRRLGGWVPISPHKVDLEVVPFDFAFKPPSTSPGDILFVLTGCIFLLVSIFHLLTHSRTNIGSSFILPLATLCSTGFSIIFALRIAIALDILIHPTSLSYALPFLISIIGFDKHLRIAHAVFHTRFICALFRCRHHAPSFGSPIPIVLVASVRKVYPFIVGHYFFEIKVLALAAFLPFGHLRQLCALAALSLVIHYFLISYFILILSLILQICILKFTKNVQATITNSTNAESSPPSRPSPSNFSLSVFLGKKCTSLYNPICTIQSGKFSTVIDTEKFQKNPALRLKLFVFTSFLLFHFTPFTLSHHSINHSNSISNIGRSMVDVSSPPITSMLNALVDPVAPEAGKELYIKLYPSTSTNLSFSSIPMSSFSSSMESPILPDHVPLSTLIFAIVILNLLLSASLAVVLVHVSAGPHPKKFILGRCSKDMPVNNQQGEE
jgi:hypothetical protein